jgi:transposase
MARPYSSDLRARVVEAVDEGATRYEAAERFGISVASAVRWHQAWRNEGTIEAKPCGGSRSALEKYTEEIVGLIEELRDWTLDEFVAAMHKRQIPGSRTALFRFLVRHGITFKKRHSGLGVAVVWRQLALTACALVSFLGTPHAAAQMSVAGAKARLRGSAPRDDAPKDHTQNQGEADSG